NRFEFISTRKRWYTASGIIVLICVISFAVRGFNFGIEFAGGSQFQIQVSHSDVTSSRVDAAFAKEGLPGENPAQTVGTGSNKSIVIKTKNIPPAQQEQVVAGVAKDLQLSTTQINATVVSSSWGHDISVKAIEGLIVFLIVVSIYISLRFQWRMAVGGII